MSGAEIGVCPDCGKERVIKRRWPSRQKLCWRCNLKAWLASIAETLPW